MRALVEAFEETGTPAVSGRTVTLTLATPVTAGQTVTVSYTDATANDDAVAIQDLRRNDADSFTDYAVINTVPDTSVAPAVTSARFVSTPSGDYHSSGKIYGSGESIEVGLTFDQAVAVETTGGTPSVTLTVGAAAKTAAYVRGTGTTELVFAYALASGDEDFDGFELVANSLALHSGTIAAAVTGGKAAALAHPGLAADGGQRVGDIARIVVIEVRDDNRDPVHGFAAGDEIKLVVYFSRWVYNDATLEVRIGDTTRQVDLDSDFQNRMFFLYTVQAGEEDVDGLDFPANPVSGSIRHGNNEPVFLEFGASQPRVVADGDNPLAGGLGAVDVAQVDGVRPEFVSAETSTDGRSIVLAFSEALSATTAAAGSFTVAVVTGTAPGVSGVSASGKTVTLGLDGALTEEQAVTVTYADPTQGDDANAIQDGAGNDAASFSHQEVTNPGHRRAGDHAERDEPRDSFRASTGRRGYGREDDHAAGGDRGRDGADEGLHGRVARRGRHGGRGAGLRAAAELHVQGVGVHGRERTLRAGRVDAAQAGRRRPRGGARNHRGRRR